MSAICFSKKIIVILIFTCRALAEIFVQSIQKNIEEQDNTLF